MVQIITNSNGGGGVGLYKYKGSVDYYEDLPTSGMKVGDTYNVVNAFTKDGKDYPAGTNVAWTGTDWDPLGGSIDLSDYQKKLVEGEGIDLDQDTNEISVDTTVIATKQDLTTKQDVISDLDTIRSNASAGKTAKDTIDTYGNIVTHNVSEFATAAQGALADTALQSNDNVSELVNDAGYLVSSDLKQSDWGQTDSSKIDYIKNKPTIGNATLTIQRNGTQVNTFTANATSNVTANISVPTKTSDITNDSGFIDKDVNNLTNYTLTTSLASVATSGSYNDLSNKPAIPGVINNLTSTSTTDALSAAQGKALKDALDNISGLGKFLSLWDSSTGQPISFPLATPYTYTTGDWFMVETVGTTNYKPSGSSYTGAASTAVETNDVQQGDVYIYDGTNWLFQDNNEVQISFANLAGQPTDNANLATALNAKQNVSNMVTTLTGADNTHYPTAKAVADAITAAGGGDMLASVYDPNNVEANAFDYNNFINTPSLAAVATSGAYSDLSGTPTLASVATSGSYNDLSNKPTIPAAQIQSDWTQADNTKKDYIKNKPSLATVATTGAYSDLSGTPTLATVATSGSYNDLSNKPTIPTVNNATLTIQKNGTTVKTFTANASTDVTANISVPTKTSDITNDSGYITKSVNNLDNYTLSSALATVATTGSYSDLSNKPTIPTDTSDLTNGAGFITGITSGDVTTALGYTPANDSSVVKTSGNQSIAGTKTFSTSPVVPSKTADATNTGTAIATEAQVYKKQDTLVSGTSIKTVNGNSLLGSGNVSVGTLTAETVVSGDSGTTYTIKKSTTAPTSASNTTITFVVE